MRRRLVLCILAFGACSRAPAEPGPAGASASASEPSGTGAASPPGRAATPPLDGTATTGAGPSGAPSAAPNAAASSREGAAGELPLLWNDAPGFRRVPPKTPARAAEYVVPRQGSDPEDAECVVMSFGPTQGGTVDENVKRWVGQFHPALPTPRRAQIELNGMKATFVEVTGTFAGNMMPNRQGFSAPADKPGWRLLGAILETPSGLWFFKLTGPDLTVRAGAQAFETMVRSARPR